MQGVAGVSEFFCWDVKTILWILDYLKNDISEDVCECVCVRSQWRSTGIYILDPPWDTECAAGGWTKCSPVPASPEQVLLLL